MLGAVGAFLAARYLLRDRVRGWLARRPAFRRIDAASGRDSVKLVALTRLSPILPFNMLNYAFGVSRVRLLPYALVSWVAMAPGTLLYVAAGALAIDLGTGGALEGAYVALRVVGVVATTGLVWWLARVARHGLDGEDPLGAPAPGSAWALWASLRETGRVRRVLSSARSRVHDRAA